MFFKARAPVPPGKSIVATAVPCLWLTFQVAESLDCNASMLMPAWQPASLHFRWHQPRSIGLPVPCHFHVRPSEQLLVMFLSLSARM